MGNIADRGAVPVSMWRVVAQFHAGTAADANSYAHADPHSNSDTHTHTNPDPRTGRHTRTL